MTARRTGPARGWSDNRDFVEFARRDPECLRVESFAPLLRENPFVDFLSLQPWPLFASPDDAAALAAIALGLDRIFKSVPERFLENDPEWLSAFYGHPPDAMDLLVAEPDGIDEAVSRGDFLETEDGFRCLEWNSGGIIGGMGLQALAPLYLACPPVARFLGEKGLRARHWNRLRALFRHMIRSTLRRGPAASGGVLNAAVIIHPNAPAVTSYLRAAGWEREYPAALAAEAPGLDGQVFLCGYDDLASRADGMFLGEHRVHAILGQQDGAMELRGFRAFKGGTVNLFTGPLTNILSHKCNLALVSEHARSDELTREERDLVERHLPWTRVVTDAPAHYDGRRLRVPELLSRYRERFVLKKGRSASGMHVFIGREHTPAEWDARVAGALAEGDWIAQERVESRPYDFLAGDGQVARHDVVWGLYAFGELYGGTLLRLQPSGRGGVVNHARGAQATLLLEVEPADAPPPADGAAG